MPHTYIQATMSSDTLFIWIPSGRLVEIFSALLKNNFLTHSVW